MPATGRIGIRNFEVIMVAGFVMGFWSYMVFQSC